MAKAKPSGSSLHEGPVTFQGIYALSFPPPLCCQNTEEPKLGLLKGRLLDFSVRPSLLDAEQHDNRLGLSSLR